MGLCQRKNSSPGKFQLIQSSTDLKMPFSRGFLPSLPSTVSLHLGLYNAQLAVFYRAHGTKWIHSCCSLQWVTATNNASPFWIGLPRLTFKCQRTTSLDLLKTRYHQGIWFLLLLTWYSLPPKVTVRQTSRGIQGFLKQRWTFHFNAASYPN